MGKWYDVFRCKRKRETPSPDGLSESQRRFIREQEDSYRRMMGPDPVFDAICASARKMALKEIEEGIKSGKYVPIEKESS